jgi:ABC-type histidine transport system ATPase subunit
MKDDTKKLKVHTINNLNKPYYIIKINIYMDKPIIVITSPSNFLRDVENNPLYFFEKGLIEEKKTPRSRSK